jgi:hypothetical protein
VKQGEIHGIQEPRNSMQERSKRNPKVMVQEQPRKQSLKVSEERKRSMGKEREREREETGKLLYAFE